MAVRGAAANSLLLKKGFDRRREEELLKVFKAADTNKVKSYFATKALGSILLNV